MTENERQAGTSNKHSSKHKSSGKKFHLPWLAKWREDFLECSRILSRERQADEIAQKLLYRLRLGLKDRNRKLEDVKVLACVTTPAMLLAAALHRWWPMEGLPAIADLGYYLMLSNPKELPVAVRSGGVVVIQDVLDTHRVSGDLVDALSQQDIEVLCVLGLVHLESNITETRATPVNYWWKPKPDSCPHHALIETPRPPECEPPKDLAEDSRAFWVEPHSLHPLRYTTLRRELTPGRDLLLDRRDVYLKRFDNSNDGCLFTAGHYVYGRRHYLVTIDIRRALSGEIGGEISRWLADICEARKGRERVNWETDRGRVLEGDVTAVLMPLHSQIHYIWPKVVNLLAQRDRRQMNWWLEATLFTGTGQEYFLPAQFEDQIKAKVREAMESTKSPDETIENPLRILILDDAIATARTAENVITTVMLKVRKAFTQISEEPGKSGKNSDNCPKPIKWIRYFSFLNQMDNPRHLLWHSIPAIGKRQVPIVFEEFAPFMGVPIYDDENCPACRDLARLTKLREKCERLEAEETLKWTKQRIKELRPIAVDNPDFRGADPKKLTTPINILSSRSKLSKNPEKYQFTHADTAIWRFYELMHLSYPPNDILLSLEDAFISQESGGDEAIEYERYRWAVLEWCLHHWARIRANAAEVVFIECAKKETERNTALVERLTEAASVHYWDSHVTNFICHLITQLAELERQRELNPATAPENGERAKRLEIALTSFFLNLSANDLNKLRFSESDKIETQIDLLSYLDKEARYVSATGPNVIRNLYRNLTKPQRYAEPAWTLETLAEALFRGRDPDNPHAGNHELLPQLITEVRTSYINDHSKRRLLRNSLNLFLGALEDIKHYYGWKFSTGIARIEEYSKPVLEWLKLSPEDDEYLVLPDDLPHLEDALDIESEFVKEFGDIFHVDVENIGAMLESEAKDKGKTELNFDFVVDDEAKRSRVLTNVQGLIICLANLTINPVKDHLRNNDDPKYRSKVKVRLLKGNKEGDRIGFRLLTNFASLEDTRRAIRRGPSGNIELSMLETFGAKFADDWEEPSSAEQRDKFTASYEFSVMAGFVPRSLRQ